MSGIPTSSLPQYVSMTRIYINLNSNPLDDCDFWVDSLQPRYFYAHALTWHLHSYKNLLTC